MFLYSGGIVGAAVGVTIILAAVVLLIQVLLKWHKKRKVGSLYLKLPLLPGTKCGILDIVTPEFYHTSLCAKIDSLH